MGWFLPLFSFGMLLLLTGSKAEVKEERDSEAAIIRTYSETRESELTGEKLPNVSLPAPLEHEDTTARESN
jgi:hypothetical protein